MQRKVWVAGLVLSAILISIGVIFIGGLFTPDVQSIKQDAWPAEKLEDSPIAVVVFSFTSRGAFTANHPIHIKVDMFISEGINITNLLPLEIIFPDSFAYPRNITELGFPPNAGSVKISQKNMGGFGEGDVEFTSGGSFGYIIYSKGVPVFYAANIPVIEVAPYEIRLQLETNERNIGMGLMAVGVTLFVGFLSQTPKKKRKSRRTEKSQHCL